MTSGSEKELLTNEYEEVELPDGDFYPDDDLDEEEGRDEEDDDEEGSDDGVEGGFIEDVVIEFVAGSEAEVAEILARIQQ